MPPASRRSCDTPGYDLGPPDNNGVRGRYVTHPENQTRAEVSEDLDRHVKMAHEIPLQLMQNETAKITAETQKIEAETARTRLANQSQDNNENPSEKLSRVKPDFIPRPTIEENATETDFSFFKAQWTRYVQAANITESQQLTQLWAACSQPLQRQLHYGGSAKCKSTNQLFNSIKRLAVKRQNNLVNIVEFQRMGQGKDENIMSFSTRLNGHADICDMYVSCQECQTDVSYKDHLIMNQFTEV